MRGEFAQCVPRPKIRELHFHWSPCWWNMKQMSPWPLPNWTGMPGGGKSSISRCLGEGPEDFQQMILLYRDYIRLCKIETEYSSIPAFCKSRFRSYGFYIEDEVILFNTVKEILLSLTLICCNVKWYYIFTFIQRQFKILSSFYIPAAWIWGWNSHPVFL